MGRYVVEIVDGTLSLADLELVIQQREELNFELVSLTAGTASGARANLLTMNRNPVAPTVRLTLVDGALGAQDQSRALNDDAGEVRRLVSYGGVWVDGALRNVVATRSP